MAVLDDDFSVDATLTEDGAGIWSPPKSTLAGTLQDFQSLYEQQRARAEAAEARCEELRWAEVAARSDAGSWKSRFRSCRRRLSEANEEAKELRRAAKAAPSLRAAVARLETLLSEDGIASDETGAVEALGKEVLRVREVLTEPDAVTDIVGWHPGETSRDRASREETARLKVTIRTLRKDIKGNDKGKVEALVKTARRRFMVPIPKVHDLSVLNERLLARCLERLDALEAGGQAAALLADLEALRDLPAVPFEACEHVPGQISSTALVRYRLVDYSAPAAHAHKKVMVKGYVDRVEIALGAEIVARHRRSYVRGDVVYDPLHYLSLLEKKPGALDQAAPLRGWKLDPAFDTLRRLLEARFGPRGKREYIQVLRLHEDFPERQVAAAVRDAVKRRLIGFDAVKHLLLARIERRPVHLDLSRYPHLPQPFVAATRSADYATLLAGGAGHG